MTTHQCVRRCNKRRSQQTILTASIVAVTLIACDLGTIQYTKHDSGLLYRTQANGDGQTIQHGEIVKMYMKQTYRDSLLSDNTDSVPFYQVHDTTTISSSAYALFGKVRKGDSIIFKALTDSIFKDKMPPFAHRGEWLYTHVYIKDVLPQGYNYEEDLKNEMRMRKIPVPGDKQQKDVSNNEPAMQQQGFR
jgi:hypothetical protein